MPDGELGMGIIQGTGEKRYWIVKGGEAEETALL